MTQAKEISLKIPASGLPSSEPQVPASVSVGFMGIPIAALLGKVGSRLMMPVSYKNERYLEHPKELKVAAPTRTFLISQINLGSNGKLTSETKE